MHLESTLRVFKRENRDIETSVIHIFNKRKNTIHHYFLNNNLCEFHIYLVFSKIMRRTYIL